MQPNYLAILIILDDLCAMRLPKHFLSKTTIWTLQTVRHKRWFILRNNEATVTAKHQTTSHTVCQLVLTSLSLALESIHFSIASAKRGENVYGKSCLVLMARWQTGHKIAVGLIMLPQF
jgi:hypothetical protein